KLPVGIYDITIEARGFRTTEVKGVKLDVGSAITVDVPLQVGAVADTMDVTAETPLVEATRSSTSTSVPARAVADLPGNGRNVITKSGTNEFHGSAFEFYRDKGMNANTFTNNRSGVKKQPYHFNQFGGSLGGPIAKNKAFFFVNYDQQKNKGNNVLTPVTLPT